MKKTYPPHTENLDVLSAFFDRVDTTGLEELEQLDHVPERELVNITIQLPRQDAEILGLLAAREGVSRGRFIGRVLRRFVRSLPSENRI